MTQLNERRAWEWDDEALDVELEDVRDFVNAVGLRKLTARPFEEMQEDFPNLMMWFRRFHQGMEGDDKGRLNQNSTSIEDYWRYMDRALWNGFIDYTTQRAKDVLPIQAVMPYENGVNECKQLTEDTLFDEMHLDDIKQQLTEEIATMLFTEFEDNIAYEMASRVKDYNVEWCNQDPYNATARAVEMAGNRYAEMLAAALMKYAWGNGEV